jgi:hypothetical protein
MGRPQGNGARQGRIDGRHGVSGEFIWNMSDSRCRTWSPRQENSKENHMMCYDEAQSESLSWESQQIDCRTNRPASVAVSGSGAGPNMRQLRENIQYLSKTDSRIRHTSACARA